MECTFTHYAPEISDHTPKRSQHRKLSPDRSMSSQTPSPTASRSVWSMVQPFVLGGASGMIATAIVQPVDMVKVRIQLAGEGVAHGAARGGAAAVSPMAIAAALVRSHGVASLYT
ncbi:hypothetical protein BC830DRAFT_1233121, partial [Chytriomyces sp. MP71]